MTIIITGAAGFIGSNFVLDWLDQSTEDVVSLDLLTYAGNLENLSSLNQNPHHHFVQGNIGDRDLVSSLLKKIPDKSGCKFCGRKSCGSFDSWAGEFLYKTSDFYHPESERCIVWNDATLNINWPKDLIIQLSPKDLLGQSFKSSELFP
jgi:hypothetical protein